MNYFPQRGMKISSQLYSSGSILILTRIHSKQTSSSPAATLAVLHRETESSLMSLFCFFYPPGWAKMTYINSMILDLASRYLAHPLFYVFVTRWMLLSSLCVLGRERERHRECKVDCCPIFISFNMVEVGKKEVGNPEMSSMRTSLLVTIWEFTWFFISKIVTPILSPLRVFGLLSFAFWGRKGNANQFLFYSKPQK